MPSRNGNSSCTHFLINALLTTMILQSQIMTVAYFVDKMTVYDCLENTLLPLFLLKC